MDVVYVNGYTTPENSEEISYKQPRVKPFKTSARQGTGTQIRIDGRLIPQIVTYIPYLPTYLPSKYTPNATVTHIRRQGLL